MFAILFVGYSIPAKERVFDSPTAQIKTKHAASCIRKQVEVGVWQVGFPFTSNISRLPKTKCFPFNISSSVSLTLYFTKLLIFPPLFLPQAVKEEAQGAVKTHQNLDYEVIFHSGYIQINYLCMQKELESGSRCSCLSESHRSMVGL